MLVPSLSMYVVASLFAHVTTIVLGPHEIAEPPGLLLDRCDPELPDRRTVCPEYARFALLAPPGSTMRTSNTTG
jgi:hypothetical protein